MVAEKTKPDTAVKAGFNDTVYITAYIFGAKLIVYHALVYHAMEKETWT